ncbi:MAG: spondin domain-containing protein, partial [Sphingomonas sp.]
MKPIVKLAFAIVVAGSIVQPALAQRKVTVTVQNIAPPNSVGVAPLNVGFSNGSFDAFNNGGTAPPSIVAAAELGNGSKWQAAFAAADPAAVIGTVGSAPMPPGAIASTTFTVDGKTNPFFSFAAMVVPSNDSFIGNDDPEAYRLFDAQGNLLVTSITLYGRDIWDAGSELFNPANAAYIAGSDATLRDPENGTIRHSFADFAKFNGLLTAPGYKFDSGMSADTPFYRITFSVAGVPEPASWGMMIL